MRVTNGVGQKRLAIGRAFGNEPIKLVILRDRGAAIEVIGEDEAEDRAIGFRKDWLYSFKPGLFARLRSAYQAGDSGQLSELWATAKPYFFVTR